ncbi:C40 family peptidase [Nocardioides sp. Kera G14]|uniref:C40 family peptidase n=1 Tax=Nocardioides sp. Kera G14 TaxID=2884264 RepID=UPI001D123966|nr:C40 family peptidase [Nocardioides sp. Kera G14]UDY22532.1 NlpC/P60 family protein [Nocardioides sp. Kera G14]
MLLAKVRVSAVAAVAGLTLAASLGFVSTTPADAKPDVKSVQAKVDALYRQADQATEDYNQAKLRLASLQSELKGLQADQSRQDQALSAVKDQLRDSMLQQLEGSNLSAVGEVVLSDDPQRFVGQLTTMSAFDNLQTSLYDDYATQAKALDLRRQATESRAAEVAATEKKLAADKKSIDAKLADAKELLSKLQVAEREAILSRGEARLPLDIPAEGRAAAAVAFATAQNGDAYVWGAAGPNAYDCSGLTMAAWAAAGVSLPHSSAAQYNSGPHVAESDLRPGDLVFFYHPISHVGMYIGNGLMVNALNPGAGVRVQSIHSLPYVGAVRPG